MSGSLNKVQLIGHCGADPELRHTNSGNAVATFSLATSERWKDKASGEQKEQTEWHRVTVFGDGLCGVIEKYVRKGSKLYVEGQLRTRKWEDKDGITRWTTEVVLSAFNSGLLLLDRANNGKPPAPDADPGRPRGEAAPNGASEGGVRPGGGRAPRDMDDEIPF